MRLFDILPSRELKKVSLLQAVISLLVFNKNVSESIYSSKAQVNICK